MDLNINASSIGEFTLYKPSAKAWQTGIVITLIVCGIYMVFGFFTLLNNIHSFSIGLFMTAVITFKISIFALIFTIYSSRGKLRVYESKSGIRQIQIEFRSGGIEFFNGNFLTKVGYSKSGKNALVIYCNEKPVCILHPVNFSTGAPAAEHLSPDVNEYSCSQCKELNELLSMSSQADELNEMLGNR